MGRCNLQPIEATTGLFSEVGEKTQAMAKDLLPICNLVHSVENFIVKNIKKQNTAGQEREVIQDIISGRSRVKSGAVAAVFRFPKAPTAPFYFYCWHR